MTFAGAARNFRLKGGLRTQNDVVASLRPVTDRLKRPEFGEKPWALTHIHTQTHTHTHTHTHTVIKNSHAISEASGLSAKRDSPTPFPPSSPCCACK